MTASPMKVTIVVPAAPQGGERRGDGERAALGLTRCRGPRSRAGRARRAAGGTAGPGSDRTELGADGRLSRSVIAVPSCPRTGTGPVRHAGSLCLTCPPSPPLPSSSSGPEFDEFYLASRRRLVLETYALTGDLSAARSAVRDAFEAAGHHWRKVSRLPDPEEWVRPRAWAMAQRRHVARLWRREKGLSAEQKTVLDALHHLPDQQRRVLLLAHVAGFTTPTSDASWARARPGSSTSSRRPPLSFCKETGAPAEGVLAAIELLAPIAEATALPPAPIIARAGRRRRRAHAVGGVVVLLALTLAGGLFVVRGGVEKPAAAADPGPAPKPVTEEMMLSLAQVQSVAPGGPGGACSAPRRTPPARGINTVCQERRFADPRGRDTFIRKFAAAGKTRRHYLETVEVSRTPRGSGRGVPDDPRLVRRLQRGAPAAAQRLPRARARRDGAAAEAAHPQRRRPHVRRRDRPDRLGDRLDGDGDDQRPADHGPHAPPGG